LVIFSKFRPGPRFLTFKLFSFFYQLAAQADKMKIKVLRGQSWGARKKWGASSKASRVFPATRDEMLPSEAESGG